MNRAISRACGPAKVTVLAFPLDEHRSGFFTPDDLRMLEVVLGVLLQREALEPAYPRAQDLARSLLGAFERGLRDEISLLKAMGGWGRDTSGPATDIG